MTTIGSNVPKIPQASATGVPAPTVGEPAAITKPLDRDFFDVSGTQRKGARALSAPAVEGVLAGFPTDLGELKTEGRWATGFQLDGGSLRLMWMSARRILESDGMPGVEIFYWLNSSAIETFAKRMQEKGATTVDFPFFEGSPPDDAAQDMSFLKRTGQKWSPSNAQVLQFVDPGKCCVDLCTGNPEALRGAMRVRVYGQDADASKALAAVQKTLGLQGLFAPPNPNALKRVKMLSLLGQTAPAAAEALKFRTLDALPHEDLMTALDKAGHHPGEAAYDAVDKANLADAEIDKRVRLTHLLYSRSPQAFLTWAKAQTGTGILPSGNNYALDNALTQLGIGANTPENTAALGGTAPDAETAKRLLWLGQLVRTNEPAARTLMSVELESIKLDSIKSALAASGVDPESSRVKNLRMEEVYPGYFATMDAEMPELCKQAGARYLYSTLDNPERVWQALTGGQKSSLTRFQEGILIQGKSSNSDFGTGGATSVFSRLVTESAIESGQKFHDWGGSRPFKLVLSRDILARTDWYGFNGDNFGRTTNLKEDNFGPKLCSTIDSKYANNNEICFPIGNDPAFIDYIVTDTAQRKTELINYLKGKGIESHNGRSLDELIVVTTGFFQLPRDVNCEYAAHKAARELIRSQAQTTANEACKTAGGTLLTPEALNQAVDTAKAALRTQLESSMKSSAETAAGNGAREVATATLKDALDGAVTAAAPVTDAIKLEAEQAAIQAAVKQADANSWLNEYSVKDVAGKAALELVLEKVKASVGSIVASLSTESLLSDMKAKAAQAAETSAKGSVYNLDYQSKNALKNALTQALTPGLTEVARKSIDEKLGPSAREAAEKAAKETIAGASADTARAQALEQELAALDLNAVVGRAIDKVAAEVSPSAVSQALGTLADQASAEPAKTLGQSVIDQILPGIVSAAAAQVGTREVEKLVTELIRKQVTPVVEEMKAKALDAAKAHFAAKKPPA